MALFGNKKPSSVEELKKAYEALSEEDKELFTQSIQGEEPVETEEVAEETVEEAPVEEETQAEEPVEETTEEETVAEEPAPIEEGTEEIHEEAQGEALEALSARIEALESKVAEYADVIADFVALKGDNEVYGVSGTADVVEGDDALTEDDRIMSNYNPKWRRG